MKSYITFWGNILSSIVNTFLESELSLPISNTNDREKCRDFDIDSENWISIGKPMSIDKFITYMNYNDNSLNSSNQQDYRTEC